MQQVCADQILQNSASLSAEQQTPMAPAEAHSVSAEVQFDDKKIDGILSSGEVDLGRYPNTSLQFDEKVAAAECLGLNNLIDICLEVTSSIPHIVVKTTNISSKPFTFNLDKNPQCSRYRGSSHVTMDVALQCNKMESDHVEGHVTTLQTAHYDLSYTKSTGLSLAPQDMMPQSVFFLQVQEDQMTELNTPDVDAGSNFMFQVHQDPIITEEDSGLPATPASDGVASPDVIEPNALPLFERRVSLGIIPSAQNSNQFSSLQNGTSPLLASPVNFRQLSEISTMMKQYPTISVPPGMSVAQFLYSPASQYTEQQTLTAPATCDLEAPSVAADVHLFGYDNIEDLYSDVLPLEEENRIADVPVGDFLASLQFDMEVTAGESDDLFQSLDNVIDSSIYNDLCQLINEDPSLSEPPTIDLDAILLEVSAGEFSDDQSEIGSTQTDETSQGHHGLLQKMSSTTEELPVGGGPLRVRRERVNRSTLTDVEKFHRIRELNNEASKRCREKRKSKFGKMESEEKELQKKNAELKERLSVLEGQVAKMKKLLFSGAMWGKK